MILYVNVFSMITSKLKRSCFLITIFLQISGVQTIDQYSLNTLTSVVNAQTHDFYTCDNCHTMHANIELFSLKSCQEKK